MPDELQPLPVKPDPMMILDRLTSQNVDPDKLGRVIDLVRDWNRDRAIEAYASDMNGCQAEIETVYKDTPNKQTSSMYAKLEGVMQKAKPVIAKWGFSLSYSEEDCPKPNHIRVVLEVNHRGGHSKTKHADFPLDGHGIKGQVNMTALHGMVSTTTYAQRTLAKMVFNITIAGEDTDGNLGGDCLSTEQTKVLNELFEDCGEAVFPGGDRQRFWDFIFNEDKTEKRMPEMLAKDFPRAVDKLNSKRRAKK
jgi:ERF superfamily